VAGETPSTAASVLTVMRAMSCLALLDLLNRSSQPIGSVPDHRLVSVSAGYGLLRR
jgi:hypothetical protein